MSVTQTVEIPANHRLTIEVPREVPAGPVVLTFTPGTAEPQPKRRGFGCLKGQIWMADDFDAPLEDFKDYMQMGRYLLDTHTALWHFNGGDALSQTARSIMWDYSNAIYMSMVSAWELAIKITIGKLRFPGNSAGFIQIAKANGIKLLPIEAAHLAALEELPLIHRDPFDRLLIATAQAERLTLITVDGKIARYDVPLVW